MHMDTQQATDALTSKSASEIARMVRQGEITAVEVVGAHLRRIEQLDGSIRAFRRVRVDEALREAGALDNRQDLSELPLAGVPVAIKDNVDVAGEASRHGSGATSEIPAQEDDELVRRLRAAGAIVIGKTTMSELAIWPFTEPKAFDVPRNPWNVERTTGGSTGGGAAAVVAGMAPLALGSDGGGSLRVPAACCGIVGLKPGPGLVPLAGGASDHWCGMTEYGPLARTTADTALMLQVLAGTDAWRESATPGSQLRIAVSTKHPAKGARISREVIDALESSAAALEAAGHEIIRADPPYPATVAIRFSRRWLAGIADDAKKLAARSDGLERRSQKMARAGRLLARLGLVKLAAADPFGRRMASWLGEYDLLLMPTLASTAVPIGRWANRGWVTTMLSVGNWTLTYPWNVARLPAASVPAGLAGDGLPLAVQLVAPVGGEHAILTAAAELERTRPWPRWGER